MDWLVFSDGFLCGDEVGFEVWIHIVMGGIVIPLLWVACYYGCVCNYYGANVLFFFWILGYPGDYSMVELSSIASNVRAVGFLLFYARFLAWTFF